jgi:AcrR family transcriptional regulator
MKYVVNAANGLRERKKARTREAIIEAALDMFERQGFDATTVEDIAAAAEVSPRTFFRYFDSKLDLVMARNTAKESHIAPLLAARPADEGPLEALRQVLQELMGDRLADPSVVREFQVLMNSPTLRDKAREHFFEEEAELVSAFAARLGTDDDDLATNVMAGAAAYTIWTVIDRWIADGGDVGRLSPMIDQAFELLEQGLGSHQPRHSTPRPAQQPPAPVADAPPPPQAEVHGRRPRPGR